MKRSIVLMVLMCCAALGAFAIKPTEYLADQLPVMELDAVVPKAFGEWRAVEQGALQVINPQAEALVNTLYQEVLNRVYVNQSGYAVMLSIAYGRDQRAEMAVHYPEACYPAQGFILKSSQEDRMSIDGEVYTVRKIETELNKQRYEPVMYWTTIGEYRSLGGLEKRLIELRYGLKGLIPDGLVFRVSSIGRDSSRQFKNQENFVQSLVQSVDPKVRRFLMGDQSI